jgi:hypothetical protein
LVSDEQHGREELIGNGGWQSHDSMGTTKEMVDDGITWGKRSARTWQSAGGKESTIGGVMRWLAGSE